MRPIPRICLCFPILTQILKECNAFSSSIRSKNKIKHLGGTTTTTTLNSKQSSYSRREIFSAILSTSAASLVLSKESYAFAGEEETAASLMNDELIDVYFGCGCFWHVQHEIVEAEKKILKRNDSSYTARAGYAGGLSNSVEGKVCYHNALNVADYGSLGHAEVVALRIPSSSFEQFAIEYFKLFDDKGNRPDQFGDRGPEYRNLVGIPGGKTSPLAEKLVSASQKSGDKLDFAVGRGDDKDLRAVSFIMDSDKFPFFIAEQYHQFHDGFNFGENYPNSYNGLAGKLAKEGKLVESACPNGSLGIGVFGL